MGVITFTSNLSTINCDDSVRLDCKFASLINATGFDLFSPKSKPLIPLKEVLIPYYEAFEFKDGVDYHGVPTGKEYTNEFGDITNTLSVSIDNCPNRLKYKADKECILISSLKGARAPALTFNFDLTNYVFSNGFYIFKLSPDWDKKFVLYLLRNKKIKNTIDKKLYRGIGISSYKESDLLKIRVPKIDLESQKRLVQKIEAIEQEIMSLKESKKSPKEIIDAELSKYFSIDVKAINKIDSNDIQEVCLSTLAPFNTGVRNSFRWSKLQVVQDALYSNLDCIQTLGSFIESTKNGWSPVSIEGGNGISVLGQENFSTSGRLIIEPSKATELTRNNIEDFFIKENDLFISRGNTVELVALASVVKQTITEDIIFPDLYIKVELDDSRLDKDYLCYLFNSFIGRLYFKYVAKGKNQSMVKVSSTELLNFRLPIPNIEEQHKLVKTIETDISKLTTIDEEILSKQEEIDKLINDELS